MLTVLDEQLIAQGIIERLRGVTYVAGGAARDWWRENTCNDIDIYTESYRPDDIPRILREFSPRIIGEAYDENNDSDISSVWQFEVNGKTIQVMTAITSLSRLIRNFPASTSKISWNNNWNPFSERQGFYTSDIFLSGEEQQIVLVNNSMCSTEYEEKTFRNSPEYDHVRFDYPQRLQDDYMRGYLGLIGA